MTKEQFQECMGSSDGEHIYLDIKGNPTLIKEQTINVHRGGYFFNGSQDQQANKATSRNLSSDDNCDEIAMVIADLYDAEETVLGEEGNEKTVKLFTDKSQWYAVFRVLHEYCNCHSKMTDFVRFIKNKGFATGEPLCTYGSIKAAASNCPKLSVRVNQWIQYKDLDGNYNKQYKVAVFLLQKLGFED